MVILDLRLSLNKTLVGRVPETTNLGRGHLVVWSSNFVKRISFGASVDPDIFVVNHVELEMSRSTFPSFRSRESQLRCLLPWKDPAILLLGGQW